jgi:hypothetical protein
MIPRLNFLCRISFDLAFLFLFLFVLLFPFHQRATSHFNIARTIDSSHIYFETDSKTQIGLGEHLPVYRFNPDWKSELGKVRVDQVQGGMVYCSFNPARFRWPMGRHGRIVEMLSSDRVKVNIGKSLGLQNGYHLLLFKERRLVGKIELTEVQEGFSVARVLEKNEPALLGLTVTEFLVATQVVHYRNTLLSFGELIALLSVVCLYGYFYRRHHQSPFLTYGPLCTAWLRGLYKRTGVRFAVQIGAGCFFVWFVSNVFVNALTYLSNHLAPWIQSWSGNTVPLIHFNQWSNLFPLYVLGSIAACAYLLKTSRSPVLGFWDLFQYRHRSVDWLNGFPREGMIWFLQVIIFYAFGSNLVFFINGNLTEVIKIAWPSMHRGPFTPFNLWDLRSILFWFQDIGRMLAYMITHKPDFWSVEIMF